MTAISQETIDQAVAGDRAALDRVVRVAEARVHPLAVRMMGLPEAAQDATQDILIRVITNLSTFRGDSAFGTWVYRIAMNHLLTARKVLARDPGLSFDTFAADLADGLADDSRVAPEDHVLLVELRSRCTMAMLVCLTREQRAAYVLGDILELTQTEATEILEVSAATYRKRLSRARAEVTGFTARACGLVNAEAPCSCGKRLPTARAKGRIGSGDRFRDAPTQADIEAQVAGLTAQLATLKLQQACGALRAPAELADTVLALVNPPG